MTRWRVAGIPVTLVADTKDEGVALLIEQAAENAGLEITRFELVPPGGRAEFVAAAGWKATSSEEMKLLPHEYTVRGQPTAGKTLAPPTEWHDWFKAQIRERGYKAPYTNPATGRTYNYVYMHFGGFKYWTFQFILNREPSDKPDDWKPEND